MAAKVANRRSYVFGIATRSANIGEVNGDAYFVKQWDNHVLVALIDGLGHGGEAAVASSVAKEFLAERFSLDIRELMAGLHESLAKTRGAVIGLARIDYAEKRFSFCGVGNIEVRVVGNPPMHPTSRDGIVGMNNLSPKKFEYSYDSLQALIMHSDGVSSKFELPDIQRLTCQPQQHAEAILNRWGNKFDDAALIIMVEEPAYY